VADTSPERGRWASRPVPSQPSSIAELIGSGTLDAELAATIWLLLEGRVPLIVAGGDASAEDRTSLLAALLDFVPGDIRVVELAGADETFAWLPQATELGWPTAGRGRADGPPLRPAEAVLLASELSDRGPGSTWGEAARIAVRAASIGYGLVATMPADSLDDVFDRLRAAPVALTDDELSRLGVVLVVRRSGSDRSRVVAAHYVRPVVRDVHGHLQRLGPAVLATWDERTDTVEQFGWGVAPELAARLGMRGGDFEIELAARRGLLDRLVREGTTALDDVRAAIAARTNVATVQPAVVPLGSSAAAPN
jgi:hypothetical protein